jgi:hypothetical protein
MVFAQFRYSMEDLSKVSDIGGKLIISDFSSVAETKAALAQLIIKCESVIGFLSSSILPISPGDVDRLNELRKELEEVAATLDANFEKNMIEAISEHEKGHFLASALITARVINCIFDQINGQSLENKIHFLKERNILKGDKGKTEEEEFIMKANKKARNIFSHDIKVFANPSESISLLGDCIRLLRLVCPLLAHG